MIHLFQRKIESESNIPRYKIYKYITPDGITIYADEEKHTINYSYLKDFLGHEMKIYMGDGTVEYAVLTMVTDEMITFK